MSLKEQRELDDIEKETERKKMWNQLEVNNFLISKKYFTLTSWELQILIFIIRHTSEFLQI
jgi:hypothetical protein